jgi:hypothetical protein
MRWEVMSVAVATTLIVGHRIKDYLFRGRRICWLQSGYQGARPEYRAREKSRELATARRSCNDDSR